MREIADYPAELQAKSLQEGRALEAKTAPMSEEQMQAWRCSWLRRNEGVSAVCQRH